VYKRKIVEQHLNVAPLRENQCPVLKIRTHLCTESGKSVWKYERTCTSEDYAQKLSLHKQKFKTRVIVYPSKVKGKMKYNIRNIWV
jgi:hypothetical protein